MIEKLNGTTETVDFMLATAVRMYRNDTAEDFPLHWHIPGEIICPIENTYDVVIGGQSLTLMPRDMLIIGSSELHSIKAPAEGQRYILNFSTAFFEQFQELSVFFSSLHPFTLLRYEEDADFNDQLFALLHHMENEYFGQTVYRDCEIASQMLHFFAMIGRHLYHQEQKMILSCPKQQEHQARFTELCNYISTHCTENLSLEELANEAGFSKYHFARLFKEMTGTTCHNFLLGRRIIYAKSLLVDFSLPITEVAMRSGFNSLATFNRIFKAQIGCTPSEFRKLGPGHNLPQ